MRGSDILKFLLKGLQQKMLMFSPVVAGGADPRRLYHVSIPLAILIGIRALAHLFGEFLGNDFVTDADLLDSMIFAFILLYLFSLMVAFARSRRKFRWKIIESLECDPGKEEALNTEEDGPPESVPLDKNHIRAWRLTAHTEFPEDSKEASVRWLQTSTPTKDTTVFLAYATRLVDYKFPKEVKEQAKGTLCHLEKVLVDEARWTWGDLVLLLRVLRLQPSKLPVTNYPMSYGRVADCALLWLNNEGVDFKSTEDKKLLAGLVQKFYVLYSRWSENGLELNESKCPLLSAKNWTEKVPFALSFKTADPAQSQLVFIGKQFFRSARATQWRSRILLTQSEEVVWASFESKKWAHVGAYGPHFGRWLFLQFGLILLIYGFVSMNTHSFFLDEVSTTAPRELVLERGSFYNPLSGAVFAPTFRTGMSISELPVHDRETKDSMNGGAFLSTLVLRRDKAEQPGLKRWMYPKNRQPERSWVGSPRALCSDGYSVLFHTLGEGLACSYSIPGLSIETTGTEGASSKAGSRQSVVFPGREESVRLIMAATAVGTSVIDDEQLLLTSRLSRLRNHPVYKEDPVSWAYLVQNVHASALSDQGHPKFFRDLVHEIVKLIEDSVVVLVKSDEQLHAWKSLLNYASTLQTSDPFRLELQRQISDLLEREFAKTTSHFLPSLWPYEASYIHFEGLRFLPVDSRLQDLRATFDLRSQLIYAHYILKDGMHVGVDLVSLSRRAYHELKNLSSSRSVGPASLSNGMDPQSYLRTLWFLTLLQPMDSQGDLDTFVKWNRSLEGEHTGNGLNGDSTLWTWLSDSDRGALYAWTSGWILQQDPSLLDGYANDFLLIDSVDALAALDSTPKLQELYFSSRHFLKGCGASERVDVFTHLIQDPKYRCGSDKVGGISPLFGSQQPSNKRWLKEIFYRWALSKGSLMGAAALGGRKDTIAGPVRRIGDLASEQSKDLHLFQLGSTVQNSLSLSEIDLWLRARAQRRIMHIDSKCEELTNIQTYSDRYFASDRGKLQCVLKEVEDVLLLRWSKESSPIGLQSSREGRTHFPPSSARLGGGESASAIADDNVDVFARESLTTLAGYMLSYYERSLRSQGLGWSKEQVKDLYDKVGMDVDRSIIKAHAIDQWHLEKDGSKGDLVSNGKRISLYDCLTSGSLKNDPYFWISMGIAD